MDRLAAYYYFRDPQALEQALLVAEDHPIKLRNVREWSRREGQLELFSHFDAKLKGRLKG
jgi:hypothetical protein